MEQPPTEEENAAGAKPASSVAEDETHVEAEAEGEGEPDPETAEAAKELPRCPNCGWRNVRLSHSKGPIDTVLKMFTVFPFRCRSCGLRFHRRWATKPAKADE
jgi:predicted Zn-ribbon and HTH transcriptional regulator